VAALAATAMLVEAIGEVPSIRHAPGRIRAYLHVRAAELRRGGEVMPPIADTKAM
jgi:hypothetical protein